ncbi:MAG: hypothetical protein WA667_02740 [Candidatus Nitrosopolaris sp.]
MTKLYFHAASSTDTGTLPSSVQSALGAPSITVDATNVNRSMDNNMGASQKTLVATTAAVTTAQKIYFTRFVTPPLAISSLASDTWNFTFVATESALNANYPCNSTAQAINVTVYIWRPSNGTKIATILDGPSAANFNEPGSHVTNEWSLSGTFAGSAVSFAVGDIICVEIYFSYTQGTATVMTDTFYYDGTTETNNNGTSISTMASHIESPNNAITFGTGATAVVFPRFFSTKPAPYDVRMFSNTPPMFST